MDFILDDQKIEDTYQTILSKIKNRRNGEVADSMLKNGFSYKMNWGVSVIDLKDIAKDYEPSHLLALKLWNKNWRESQILASMLDESNAVTEEQLDFWTKSFENTEIAEHVVANLWVKTPFSFIKSLEWCRGKKHIVRYTGLHLMGRLAMVDKSSIDEMFEPFFDVLESLAKDPELYHVFYRSFCLLGSRSLFLNKLAVDFAKKIGASENLNSKELGGQILDELLSDFVFSRLNNKD